MSERAVAHKESFDIDIIERTVVEGDLSGLKPEERTQYYARVCESLGLNPYTRPFDYLRLNNKLVLYARKDATDQLRRNCKVSIVDIKREQIGDLYVVTAYAQMPDGRRDSEIGAVNIKGLAGEGLANAMMKATTKAKRRVTLSICGLGFLDETEVSSVPTAKPVLVNYETGEIIEPGVLPPLPVSTPPPTPAPTLAGEVQRKRQEAVTPTPPVPAPVDPEYRQLRTEFIGMARMAGLDATEAERLFAEHAEGDTDAAQRLVDAVVAEDFDIKREWEMLLETERELAAQGSDAPLPEPPPEPEPVPAPTSARPAPTQAAPQNRPAPRTNGASNGNPAQSGDLATAAQRRMVEALLAQAKEKRDLTGLTRGQAEKMITELKDRLSPARAG